MRHCPQGGLATHPWMLSAQNCSGWGYLTEIRCTVWFPTQERKRQQAQVIYEGTGKGTHEGTVRWEEKKSGRGGWDRQAITGTRDNGIHIILEVSEENLTKGNPLVCCTKAHELQPSALMFHPCLCFLHLGWWKSPQQPGWPWANWRTSARLCIWSLYQKRCCCLGRPRAEWV